MQLLRNLRTFCQISMCDSMSISIWRMTDEDNTIVNIHECNSDHCMFKDKSEWTFDISTLNKKMDFTNDLKTYFCKACIYMHDLQTVFPGIKYCKIVLKPTEFLKENPKYAWQIKSKAKELNASGYKVESCVINVFDKFEDIVNGEYNKEEYTEKEINIPFDKKFDDLTKESKYAFLQNIIDEHFQDFHPEKKRDVKVIFNFNFNYSENITEKLPEMCGVESSQIEIIHILEEQMNDCVQVSGKLTNASSNDIKSSLRKSSDFNSGEMFEMIVKKTLKLEELDSDGNKIFTTSRSYKIGPKNAEKYYKQPFMYKRFGLKVLDKFGVDETWLKPFKHEKNWYRAYHGPGKAAGYIKLCVPHKYDLEKTNEDLNVQAIGSIYREGFQDSIIGEEDGGVYCSPSLDFLEKSDNKLIGKKGGYFFAIQVAVNPKSVKFITDNIWHVNDVADIRPYGLLIKDSTIEYKSVKISSSEDDI